jgi:hypothetical protein
MDRKKPNRGVQSFTKSVPLKPGETCHSLKRHYKNCYREVVGFLDMLAAKDVERFAWPRVSGIVKRCNKYRKNKERYKQRQVKYVLAMLHCEPVVITDAERVRGGALRRGWLMAPHSALTLVENGCCDLIGQRHWERQIETEPDPDKPGHRQLKKIGPILWPESSGGPAPVCDALAVPSHSTGNAVATKNVESTGSSLAGAKLEPSLTHVQPMLNPDTTVSAAVIRAAVHGAVHGSVHSKTPSVHSAVHSTECTLRAQSLEEKPICETAASASRGQPCKSTEKTVITVIAGPEKNNAPGAVSLNTTDQNLKPETITQHFGSVATGEWISVITGGTFESTEESEQFDRRDLSILIRLCEAIIQEWGQRYYLGLKTHGDIMAEAMGRFTKKEKANVPKYWYPIAKRLREWPAQKNFVELVDEIAELRKLFTDAHPQCPDCQRHHPGKPCGKKP